METIIWIIQGLLAIAFLLAGIMKLVMAKNEIKEKVGGWVDDFTYLQIKLIGTAEILGAVGLVLPVLLNIYPVLTPAAAFGLLITMLGAARIHWKRKESIGLNILLSLLLLLVIIGRIYIVPVI